MTKKAPSSIRILDDGKIFRLLPTWIVDQINAVFPKTAKFWLTDLFHSSKKALQPIRHLLLIHFLGFTAKGFYEYISNSRKDQARQNIVGSDLEIGTARPGKSVQSKSQR